MKIAELNLQQIAINVFHSMLGLELIPLRPEFDTASKLVASVEILGERHTLVEVFAHEELMAKIAEVMFWSEAGSLSDSEIRDAFGEIANMIGGNVKGFLDEKSTLTLPVVGEVVIRENYLSNYSLRKTFGCCGYPLTIVLSGFVPSSRPTAAADAAAVAVY